MSTPNHKPLISQKTLSQITMSILLVIGATDLAWAQTGLVPTIVGQLSPNLQRRNEPPRGATFFELDGSDVKACRPKPEASKGKECQAIGKGYTVAVRTAGELLGNGNIKNAESLLRQIIERFPKKAEAYYKLGTLLTRRGLADEAMTNYEKAIEINPNYAKARNELGALLASQGKLDEAISQWQQSVNINQDYAEAWNNLGIGLLEKGQEDQRSQAIANLQKAKELFIKQGKTQAANRVTQFLQQQGGL
jgi:tetratricopeptide (TPR) repeat protein